RLDLSPLPVPIASTEPRAIVNNSCPGKSAQQVTNSAVHNTLTLFFSVLEALARLPFFKNNKVGNLWVNGRSTSDPYGDEEVDYSVVLRTGSNGIGGMLYDKFGAGFTISWLVTTTTILSSGLCCFQIEVHLKELP
ncbi:hypothetical protein HPP92_028991, partial [Vanilla planifolia]